MKDKDKSEQVVFRTEPVEDEMYRVTKNGDVATLWRCRSNGVWREVVKMSLHDFEAWAVHIGLLQVGNAEAHALLSTLAPKVKEKVHNS